MTRKKGGNTAEIKRILSLAIADRKAAEKNAQSLAKKQLKELRKYWKPAKGIDLRKKLTGREIAKVKKAFIDYTELTARPHKVYRSKSNKKLKTAQKFARHDKGGAKFDVAFIPTGDIDAKVIVKEDRIELHGKYVKEIIVYFDPRNLVLDSRKELDRVLSQHKDTEHFILMAGKYDYNGPIDRENLMPEIAKIQLKYGHDRESGGFYGDWLLGMTGIKYSSTTKFREFRLKKREEYNKQKKKRKNERRNNKRRYGAKI